MRTQQLFPLLLIGLLAACQNTDNGQSGDPADTETMDTTATYATTGSIERLSPKLDAILPTDARIEILAEGFEWSEGPLWLEDQQMVIFSDIPNNRINSWKPGDQQAAVYLEPSGYTGETGRGGELGCNGLLLDPEGKLVLCQHGDRRIARMDALLDAPKSEFTTLADNWQGKKLNSPNDAAYHANGSLYFTDPPYGLEKRMDDPGKEIDFQGVYRIDPSGKLHLLTDEITRPNGIGFSPDGKTAYVASSDPDKAIWMAFDVNDAGDFENGRIFYDVTDQVGQAPGLPDGLKVHSNGHIFATGPGGVYIFSPEGEKLGLIRTGEATANCAFDTDEKTLYMTADMYLLRVELE
ncbi:SMP-30/gluconolactonase/LRE family protein [Flavilitoribacter nigricans]|uniref:Gluconolactonase n=1 Tax=Flavilitoribacter nigricans (strain ATCC 23147 / DSM 23189 / NBRC 102662 / NCIMB 1420 / SS-2) TaxID=1122177 RepID=A0A2D0NIL4_FLAN2|nr:SMP-30/gluconolactonase/LRE family protein [Flavilitoribacter nigricans]PHN08345.1 gluconolactonase [Flavilitoribacter nigricans DSM 23189 = NBRC 102662]